MAKPKPFRKGDVVVFPDRRNFKDIYIGIVDWIGNDYVWVDVEIKPGITTAIYLFDLIKIGRL